MKTRPVRAKGSAPGAGNKPNKAAPRAARSASSAREVKDLLKAGARIIRPPRAKKPADGSQKPRGAAKPFARDAAKPFARDAAKPFARDAAKPFARDAVARTPKTARATRGENAPGARNAGAFGNRTTRGENAPGARNAGAFGNRTTRTAERPQRAERPARAQGKRAAEGAKSATSGARNEPVWRPEAPVAPSAVAKKHGKGAPPKPTETASEKPEKRIPKPAPAPISVISEEPHPGMWIFTTRLGAERDVVDELLLAKVVDPAARVLAPALVLAPKLPKREGQAIDLTFARQGFEVLLNVRTHDIDEMVTRIARSVRGQLTKAERYALHVWVADSDEGNALSSLAEDVEARLAARIAQLLPEITRVDDAALRRLGTVQFVQVCLLEPSHAAAGVAHSNRALSLARGGRTRVRITGDFPSRAARKVEEALAWLGDGPGPSELCVDLGAAPGGWTYMLLKRRARVIAVDPAKLKPEILEMKGVKHVQESAFTYTPDEPVDWLFCDMAWRPLEAAALLAKWGRRRWARMLVANVKMPMTRKAELVARVRDILTLEGHWKNVHIKQLYHDREEVTITAHLG